MLHLAIKNIPVILYSRVAATPALSRTQRRYQPGHEPDPMGKNLTGSVGYLGKRSGESPHLQLSHGISPVMGDNPYHERGKIKTSLEGPQLCIEAIITGIDRRINHK